MISWNAVVPSPRAWRGASPATRAMASGVAVAMLASAAFAGPAAQGSSAEIPAAWFFSGADRPKALKSLEGRPAPEIATQAWIGAETSIADSRGKVVVVDFWATWCDPCMAAIPENVAMVKKLGDQGLVVIGVHDGSSGWEKAANVVRDKGINYPVAKDSGESVKRYRLEFWPTYVVIDRAGIVRAAGLLPDRVDDVVQMLLAEPPPEDLAKGDGPQADFGPPEWYYGGATRPAWLRAAEGRIVPQLAGTQWYGRALRDEECKGRVIVMHFLTPGSALSRRQLAEIATLEPEFGPQGVAFIGVCDARADWVAAQASFKDAGLRLSIVRDAPTPAGAGVGIATATSKPTPGGAVLLEDPEELELPDGVELATPSGSTSPPSPTELAVAPPAPPPFGATAATLGLRLMPITIVIDRNGRVAAAGVRAEHVKAVVNKLLARSSEESKGAAPSPR